MVDFNNETTISTPAGDVIKILILQRRYDLFESLEAYNKQRGQGTDPNIGGVSARLYTFWLELEAMLKRRLKAEEYETLYQNVISDKEANIILAINTINAQLDFIKLTKIDERQVYESHRAEKENKVKSM